MRARIIGVCVMSLAAPVAASGQQPTPPQTGGQPTAPGTASRPPGAQPGAPAASQAPKPAASTTTGDKPAFKPEEIEQMVAPLALYPDSLLTQILMASTYPIEIVQAERWAKANKELKGEAFAKKLEEQEWDASVKSLVNFPEVLSMMSENLDWTVKLGDAFIAQQKEVLAAVQKLRGKAKESGNLESSPQQTVEVVQEGTTQIIQIESSDPDVIYVPTYNPTVVYGTWPYPAYPPAPYYPPGYVASNVLSFGAGVACGLAWGYAWGDCDWGHGDVDIDIDQNFERNTNINRENYAKRENIQRGERGNWQHNSAHRGGVPYRDNATAQRFGGTSSGQAARARQDYRGYGGSGGMDRSSFAGSQRPSAGQLPANRTGAGASGSRVGAGAGGVQRPSGGSGSRVGTTTGGSRSSYGSGTRSGAMSGVNQSRGTTMAQSQRGYSSRSGSASRSSGGSRGGSVSRGGGGGGRGGGGRGGGGRR